jgi:hypothetical protein
MLPGSTADEAPLDGQLYARQNGRWVTTLSGTGIADAPTDGGVYERKSGAWGDLSVHKSGDTMTGALIVPSIQISTVNGVVTLTLNASAELVVTANSGPNTGKSVNLTATKWA